MARYYRRRYTRVVKPKKKWASNISVINGNPIDQPFYITLVQNSQQISSPTPVIVKTGNFKVSLDCFFETQQTITANVVVQVFILYVPEGWAPTNISGIVAAHPEWIMASKTVGGSVTEGKKFNLETLNMSTRLKRNLNSGDGIVLLFVANALPPGSSLTAEGHVRYWTCAN